MDQIRWHMNAFCLLSGHLWYSPAGLDDSELMETER